MKNIPWLLMKLAGIALVIFQLYQYIFARRFNPGALNGKSLVYDIAFLAGFNVYLLSGILLIGFSYIIKKRIHSAKTRR